MHESARGIVSRVTPVHTAVRNCTRDEGGGPPFEVGNQVLISSHRKLLSPKEMAVNVAEKSDLFRAGLTHMNVHGEIGAPNLVHTGLSELWSC